MEPIQTFFNKWMLDFMPTLPIFLRPKRQLRILSSINEMHYYYFVVEKTQANSNLKVPTPRNGSKDRFSHQPATVC
jgi:hypothetical protein